MGTEALPALRAIPVALGRRSSLAKFRLSLIKALSEKPPHTLLLSYLSLFFPHSVCHGLKLVP